MTVKANAKMNVSIVLLRVLPAKFRGLPFGSRSIGPALELCPRSGDKSLSLPETF